VRAYKLHKDEDVSARGDKAPIILASVLDTESTQLQASVGLSPRYVIFFIRQPVCIPQILHGIDRARIWASELRGRRLTAWAMAWHNRLK
jgi:hypothetical protein